MRHLPYLLIPAVALVAQAPANLDLAQRFNTELPGVNQMLKELKFQEAMAKTQSLIPAERPRFDMSSPKAMGQSLDNGQGLMSLYRLYASVVSQNGLWEKAVEVQEERAQAARAFLAEVDKAQAPVLAQWKKASQDSTEFLAKGEARKNELEKKVADFKKDFEAIKAEKRKLSKKEVEEFNARAAQVQQDEQELAQLVAALPVHKQNVASYPKVMKTLGDNHKEAEGMVQAADEAVAKAKKVVSDQNDEITQFNTQQMIKKVKVVGRKTWVDAVLRSPDNLTKLGTPQDQGAFLNRMLVLDPGNAAAQKALDNLKAGKEAFAKEVKPARKGGARKK